jgi:beta-galactosidase
MFKYKFCLFLFVLCGCNYIAVAQRQNILFNDNWKFVLNVDSAAVFNNSANWSNVNLPHDWSINLPFSKSAAATTQGGALPGGIGWYKKIFVLPKSAKGNSVEIEFDGVYKNAEVWVNNIYLGKRPNGYVNFKYELTPFLNSFPNENEILVKCDNSQQPNSRWYSGSGIYRDVFMNIKSFPSFKEDEIFITTPLVSSSKAIVQVNPIKQYSKQNVYNLNVVIKDENSIVVATHQNSNFIDATAKSLQFEISNPKLWSPDQPNLYSIIFQLANQSGKIVDEYILKFGIRTIRFSADSGFFLNNKYTFLKGVCMHHDLGALGAAYNQSAARRQLDILKEMGCNAIRFSHNPPAADLLNLCDEMGFLVIDEAFDIWNKKKNKFDYHKDFVNWSTTDLKAMIIRDRNHPSIIAWSIGNEIREQFDSSGIVITKTLADVCNYYDGTRPVTSALTETHFSKNYIAQSNALNVLGFNYKDYMYDSLSFEFPNKPIIATETASALATRGVYTTNPNVFNVWPPNFKVQDSFTDGLPDFTCPAYDNTFAYWGNTHEASLNAVKKHKNIAGAFVWSGFDYLGEPVPYPWPARSSYFGIVDLAGFPKDVYYMYKSEWSNQNVLHVFPHWNHQIGDTVDVWAYYNQATEVEAFVNDKYFGKRKKENNELHVNWKIPFEPGTLKVISYNEGKKVNETITKTTGEPYKIALQLYKPIKNSSDYLFITATALDKLGNEVPTANNEINFSVNKNTILVATDNGLQTDTTAFNSKVRKLYNGKLLIIVKLKNKKLNGFLKAKSPKLKSIKMPLNILR